MSILVLYATKSGAAEQCAKLLSEQLSNCTICNIEISKPNMNEFDHIIVGAGVRDGKIYKPIRDFIKKNHAELLSKSMGYYICNEKPKKTDEIIGANFPADLRSKAVCIESFGGYKSNTVPRADGDYFKGIWIDRIHAFSDKFKS